MQNAVAEAVMRFNHGTQHASSSILRELQLEQSGKGSSRAAEKDRFHAVKSEKKRAASAAFQTSVKRRQHGKPDEDYCPGAF